MRSTRSPLCVCVLVLGASGCELLAGIGERSAAEGAGGAVVGGHGGSGGTGGSGSTGGSGGTGGFGTGGGAGGTPCTVGEVSCVDSSTSAYCDADEVAHWTSCPQGCVGGACLPVSSLALGNQHSCALLHDGTVWCWGSNDDGALGVLGGPRLVPVHVSALPRRAQELVAGAAHTCALLEDGSVYCWGDNQFGAAGSFPLGTDALTPQQVGGLADIVRLGRAKSHHTCAIDAVGTLHCWGQDDSGQLGSGTATEVSLDAVAVVSLQDVSQVATGCSFTCALAGQDAWCWGSNYLGRLGVGSTAEEILTPTLVTDLGNVVEVAAGCTSACARGSDGLVRCWGNQESNFLGDGATSGFTNTPSSPVMNVSDALQMPGGGWIQGARTDAGEVWVWGPSQHGGLGNGSTSPTLVNPSAKVLGLDDTRSLAIGWEHLCALHGANEELLCWGYNNSGQLGINSLGDVGSPTYVVWDAGGN